MYRINVVTAFTLACAAVLSLLACDDGTPTVPVQLSLTLMLISPNGPEGAAVFETTDEGIVAVGPPRGDVFHRQADGLTRIVVVLDDPGEISVTLDVEDLGRLPQLEVVEVADPENGLRTDLSDYEVELVTNGAAARVHP